MKKSIGILAMLAAIAALAPAARAEDIDIYGLGGGGPKPNIVIVFDNASRNNSNFSGTCPYSAITISTLQDATRCALAVAVQSIANQPTLLGKFNMGLLVYGYQSNQGGQWIIPNITPGAKNVSTSLPTMDQAGINAFLTAVTPQIGTANEASASGGMQEAWAFITGSPAAATEVFGSNTTYVSHEGLSCQKSFIIFIGGATGNNGEPETGSNGSGGAGGAAGLANAGATAAQQVQINTSTLGPNTGDDSAWGDEWARFLNQTDFSGSLANSQNVVTYTIAAGGTRPNYVQFLHSMANQGGGKAFVAADINSMVQALLQIFNEIQSVNSVFASSSLPISSNSQGTYLNQVFIGMFRPDGSANPRWMGNLKQYQFGVGGTVSNPTLFLADKNGNAAISGAGTGFLSPNAVSFWNPDIDTSKLPDSIGGFWVNNPQSAGGGYDNPDGEIVEKGGVSQQIRLANLQDDYTATAGSAQNPRRVYTCTGSGGNCNNGDALSATLFATSNPSLTNASFGISAPTTSISTFSRASSTVTATLSSAPSPALTNGQSVTIQGASSPELNGIFTITLINATQFSYTIVTNPPTPATGSYTASVPSNPKTISSLTRAGATVTATSNGHNYNVGDIVTITGANGPQYNVSAAITSTTSNTFTYTISDAPTVPTSGGTADIGTTHTNGFTFTSSQIKRDATHSDNTSIVTITTSGNLNSSYAAGAKVNVSGVVPSGYNVTLAMIIAGGGNGTGNTCPGGSKQKSFCYSIMTTPGTPDAGGTPKVDRTATSVVSALSRTTNTCTGTTPSPATTVTVTSNNHPFVTGDMVSISGNPVGANESAYVGTFPITNTGTNTFTYSTTTTPSCSPSASGASAITSTTGIDKNSLINWVRGDDNVGDEPSPGNGITVRPSVHGDVLHSRPTVVNYGGSIGVVVFYGANDGTFRAINGNQPLNGSTAVGGAPPGGEIWSFIPTEFFTRLPRLYLNSPSVKIASTPTGLTPTPLPKDYFFDGSTGVYQTYDSNGNTTGVTLFLTERRGGRFIYALDVTDPTAPVLKWKKSSTDAGMAELGLTWSAPKAGLVRGYAKPVVIFGAGYDTNEDSEPPVADTMGRGIFVLDATDGSLVWRAGPGGSAGTCTGNPCLVSDMTYAIPADIALINRDFDTTGYIDRLYAADLGGNIWRVDLESAGYTSTNVDPSTWKVTKFAAVGGSGTNPTKRKFFYPPDIVATKKFDMVLAATGDREHPIYSANTSQAYSIVNRFYGFKDVNTGSSVPSGWTTASEILDSTSDTDTSNPAVSNMTDVTPTASNPTPTPYDPSTANSGFYITFMSPGEKAVNAPLTVGGYTYVGTNTPQVPSATTCTTLGVARGYAINFLTGSAMPGGSLYTTFATGGLPPSPVAGLVSVTVDGKSRKVPFCLGCGDPTGGNGPDATSSLGGGKPRIPIPPIRKRIYWYLDKHDAT